MPATPLRGLIAMVLVALALLGGGCSRSAPKPAAPAPLAVTAPAGHLQEVAPPGAVQQLAERLGEREPHVEVLAPANNALLPAGPWTLKLKLSDWPLVDAGDLGLGPQLVVQVDGAAPLRISQPDQLSAIPMAELSPGSHRVTVYAARPWGEAVKSPGASRQIQVHRVAANPAQLPAPNSPQLIASSPTALSSSEPVLIDWLLFDAPLQHLRDGDDSWRLRVTVNGDSFLVDRQVPLWLKGFRRGSNAVQLELLDGRGDPLNPPFNSLVQEVVINGGAQAAWQRPSLSAQQLALLSGASPPLESPPQAVPASEEAVEQAGAGEPEIEEPEAGEPQPVVPAPASTQPAARTLEERARPADLPPDTSAATSPTSPDDPAPVSPSLSPVDPQADLQSEPQPEPQPDPQPERPEPERIAPSTTLTGSARELVNADGSLVKPQGPGPLARLREKLGG